MCVPTDRTSDSQTTGSSTAVAYVINLGTVQEANHLSQLEASDRNTAADCRVQRLTVSLVRWREMSRSQHVPWPRFGAVYWCCDVFLGVALIVLVNWHWLAVHQVTQELSYDPRSSLQTCSINC